jgi:hypothetical protein
MNRLIGLALLVGGIVLIVLGLQGTRSFSSDVSTFFTGSPTNKAVWMVMGGTLASILGLTLTWRRAKHV